MSARNSRLLSVLVTASPTLVLNIRDERDHFYIEMASGTGMVIGPSDSQMLKPLKTVGDSYGDAGYQGAVYASVSGGTGTLLVWEVDR